VRPLNDSGAVSAYSAMAAVGFVVRVHTGDAETSSASRSPVPAILDAETTIWVSEGFPVRSTFW
jgi:hypothetical protein